MSNDKLCFVTLLAWLLNWSKSNNCSFVQGKYRWFTCKLLIFFFREGTKVWSNASTPNMLSFCTIEILRLLSLIFALQSIYNKTFNGRMIMCAVLYFTWHLRTPGEILRGNWSFSYKSKRLCEWQWFILPVNLFMKKETHADRSSNKNESCAYKFFFFFNDYSFIQCSAHYTL